MSLRLILLDYRFPLRRRLRHGRRVSTGKYVPTEKLQVIPSVKSAITPFLVCVWPMFHNYSAANSAVRH